MNIDQVRNIINLRNNLPDEDVIDKYRIRISVIDDLLEVLEKYDCEISIKKNNNGNFFLFNFVKEKRTLFVECSLGKAIFKEIFKRDWLFTEYRKFQLDFLYLLNNWGLTMSFCKNNEDFVIYGYTYTYFKGKTLSKDTCTGFIF